MANEIYRKGGILKAVCILVAVVLILLVGGAALLGSQLGALVKKGVEEVGPQATQTAVKLDSASIGLFSGKGELTGFSVGNPEGFASKQVFVFKTVALGVDPWSLTGDLVVIDEITVKGAELTCEIGSKGSNIHQIQKNIKKFASSGAGKAEPAAAPAASGKPAAAEQPQQSQQPKQAKAQKNVLIKHLLIEDCTLLLSAPMVSDKPISVPLPRIEMRDIGGKSQGKPMGEAMSDIWQGIAAAAAEAAASSKDFVNQGKEKLKDMLEGSGDSSTLKNVGDSLKKGTESATEKIKGLFK